MLIEFPSHQRSLRHLVLQAKRYGTFLKSEPMKFYLTIFMLLWVVMSFSQTNKTEEKCKFYFDSISNRTIYSMVDVMPEFPGGTDSLFSFILKNLNWPNTEVDFQGKVYISLIVETDGRLTNKFILKGIEDLADKEALRIVEKMPKWEVGKCNGMKVPVKFIVPIKFELK